MGNVSAMGRLILLDRAISQLGIKEIPGDKSNPEINKYFDIINQKWADDEVAWCSAFVNWVCKIEDFEYTGKLNARSWLQYETVFNPKPGHIVVFWRESPNSWKGHVGFFLHEYNDFIYCLGGNQSNEVCIKVYSKKRVLKYVIPPFKSL